MVVNIPAIYPNGLKTITPKNLFLLHLIMSKKIILSLLIIFLTNGKIFSQDYNLPIERSIYQRYEEKLSAREISFHTAFKTWRADELRKIIPFDSLNTLPVKDCKFNRTWLGRKLPKEHLFTVDEENFHL